MGLYSIPFLHLPQSKPHAYTVKIQAQISMKQHHGPLCLMSHLFLKIFNPLSGKEDEVRNRDSEEIVLLTEKYNFVKASVAH